MIINFIRKEHEGVGITVLKDTNQLTSRLKKYDAFLKINNDS